MKFLAALIYFFFDVDMGNRHAMPPKPKPNVGKAYTNGFPIKNQKGFTVIELLIVLVVIGIIFWGGFKLWAAGEKADLESCQQRYGSSYTLGHSNTNSSIKWCVSPEGVMKDL